MRTPLYPKLHHVTPGDNLVASKLRTQPRDCPTFHCNTELLYRDGSWAKPGWQTSLKRHKNSDVHAFTANSRNNFCDTVYIVLLTFVSH